MRRALFGIVLGALVCWLVIAAPLALRAGTIRRGNPSLINSTFTIAPLASSDVTDAIALPRALTITGPAHTNILGVSNVNWGTEVFIDLSRTITLGDNDFDEVYSILIEPPTLSTVAGVSSVTIDNAATVNITAAPTAAGNVTIANPYALRVASGAVLLSGALTVGVDATGTSMTYEKSAAGQFLIDGRTVVATAPAVQVNLSTATANVEAVSIDFANTANVNGTAGLTVESTVAVTALTGANISAGISVTPRGNASDASTSFRPGIVLNTPSVASGGVDTGILVGTGYERLIETESGIINFLDYAPTIQTENTAGAAEAWTFTHADGAAGNNAGATLTQNFSAATGNAANGGYTGNIGNAGTGGAGVYLIQADTGEDMLSISAASTGVGTIVIGNATAVFSIASDAMDVSSTGAVSGVTTLAIGGALSGATTGAFSGALAANGGITFDAATDTLGAFTLAGAEDANGNNITNVGSLSVGTVVMGATGTIDSGTSAGNTFTLRARDVDGAAYTTFLTLTANNTPTLDIGVHSVSGNLTFTGTSHLIHTGTAPSIGTCGTSPSIVGTDLSGIATVGTGGPTACTISFAAAYSNAPACSITGDQTSVDYRATTSTSALVIACSADCSSDVIMYICVEGS